MREVASFLILAPLAGLFIINLPVKVRMRRAAFWIIAALFLAQLITVATHPFFFWSAYPDPLGPFFAFELSIDSLSLVVLFCISLVGLVGLVVGRYTITGEKHKFYFENLLLVLLIAMNATTLATDLFSLYFFVEISALCSFILIALHKDKLAIEAAFKYFLLSAFATVLMLCAIAIFLLVSGSLSFTAIYGAFAGSTNGFALRLAVGLFLCGILIKSGIVPFHWWLPDAYSASPAPVSLLLAGIITKVSGVYVLMRLCISVFILTLPMQKVLLWTGIISIFFGALSALTQKDLKRMLAYSSISQMGYIVIALGCGSALAVVGAIFHFFNHAVFKTLLFTNAAALHKELGTTDMQKMQALEYRMPVTGYTSLIGFLSTAGIPPFAGFWSKLIIILALWQSNHAFFALAALLAGVLTMAYFLVIQRQVFFNKKESQAGYVSRLPWQISACAIVLALLTLAAGIGVSFMLRVWMLPVRDSIHSFLWS